MIAKKGRSAPKQGAGTAALSGYQGVAPWHALGKSVMKREGIARFTRCKSGIIVLYYILVCFKLLPMCPPCGR